MKLLHSAFKACTRYLLVVLIVMGATVSVAQTPSTPDQKAALKLLKAYIAASAAGKYSTTLYMTEPQVLEFLARKIDMNREGFIRQYVHLLEKKIDKSSLVVQPNFDKIHNGVTSAGRPYAIVPVYEDIKGGLLLSRKGTATYIAYKEGNKWYGYDVFKKRQLKHVIRFHPDLAEIQPFKKK